MPYNTRATVLRSRDPGAKDTPRILPGEARQVAPHHLSSAAYEEWRLGGGRLSLAGLKRNAVIQDTWPFPLFPTNESGADYHVEIPTALNCGLVLPYLEQAEESFIIGFDPNNDSTKTTYLLGTQNVGFTPSHGWTISRAANGVWKTVTVGFTTPSIRNLSFPGSYAAGQFILVGISQTMNVRIVQCYGGALTTDTHTGDPRVLSGTAPVIGELYASTTQPGAQTKIGPLVRYYNTALNAATLTAELASAAIAMRAEGKLVAGP